jgi:hypothetical protein
MQDRCTTEMRAQLDLGARKCDPNDGMNYADDGNSSNIVLGVYLIIFGAATAILGSYPPPVTYTPRPGDCWDTAKGIVRILVRLVDGGQDAARIWSPEPRGFFSTYT